MYDDNMDSWHLGIEANGRYKAGGKHGRMEASGTRSPCQGCPSITYSYLEENQGLPHTSERKILAAFLTQSEETYQLCNLDCESSMAYERTRAPSPSAPPVPWGMVHVRNSRP